MGAVSPIESILALAQPVFLDWGLAAGDGRTLAIPMVFVLAHEVAQHGIDAGLIAFAAGFEEVDHIFVQAYGNEFFKRRINDQGVGPVHIDEIGPIGVVAHGCGNLFVRQSVQSVRSPPLAIFSRISSAEYLTICSLLILVCRTGRYNPASIFRSRIDNGDNRRGCLT